MSRWRLVSDPKDIEIVDDEIQIRYSFSRAGNEYIYFKTDLLPQTEKIKVLLEALDCINQNVLSITRETDLTWMLCEIRATVQDALTKTKGT